MNEPSIDQIHEVANDINDAVDKKMGKQRIAYRLAHHTSRKRLERSKKARKLQKAKRRANR